MQFHRSYIRAVEALEQLTTDMPEIEIVQSGVDIAQTATSSRIAYLHYLNDDQNTIELGVWSHDTRAGCNAVYDRHYPITSAGIWADSVRYRKPCVHNDYAGVATRHGLPDGHARLIRHLGLPVIDGGAICMLIGVGNKDTDYDHDDVATLDMVAKRIWSVTRQRRVLTRLLDLEQRFRHVQRIASVSGLEYDVDEDALFLDDMFSPIFLTQHSTETPTNLHELLGFVATADHEHVRKALSGTTMERRVLEIGCRRASGEAFPARLKVESRPRAIGRGIVCVGILQDVSEELAVEELRQHADIDPLTDLPNRNRLHELFNQGLGRRGKRDAFAFHYIDLDDFKPVNDSCGHLVGDEVLRVVAQRLQQVVRKDDLLVRMGGDEFAIVQTGLESVAGAQVMADKIIATISQPIHALGVVVRVGASIGINICDSHDIPLKDVSAAADRALYQAKAAGGRRFIFSARLSEPG